MIRILSILMVPGTTFLWLALGLSNSSRVPSEVPSGQGIKIDCDKCSVLGVRVGEPISPLIASLGKPDVSQSLPGAHEHHYFEWKRSGVTAESYENCVDSWTVHFWPEIKVAVVPDVKGGDDADKVVKVLGEPDVDVGRETGRLLIYRRAKCCIVFSVFKEMPKGLVSINVFSYDGLKRDGSGLDEITSACLLGGLPAASSPGKPEK